MVIDGSLLGVEKLINEVRRPPKALYAWRTGEIQDEIEKTVGKVGSYTLALMIFGGAALICFYEAILRKALPIWFPFLALIIAAYALERRSRAQRQLIHLWSLEDFYARGMARLERDWKSLDGGAQFADLDHSYAADLDLFGQGSLYQLVCSARTQIGRETLVDWMKVWATVEEVRGRQEAVVELRERRDLPEALALAGKTDTSDVRPEFLKSWATAPGSVFPIVTRLTAFSLSLAAILLPVTYFIRLIDPIQLWRGAIFVLAAQGLFAVSQREAVKRVLESVGPLAIEMPMVREISRIVEREKFLAVKLQSIASSLARDGAASARIGRLQRLLWLLDQRNNEMFLYVSFCLLWTTQFTMAISAWRDRHGPELREWLKALGEVEALISLSTYAYEHPADSLPDFAETGVIFEAEGLAHPLLDEATGVRNDVRLDDAVRFLIISGSNMSGKSTLLRAIGLNAVLAFLGAPVRCDKMSLSNFAICAAIRVEDSLRDGRSNFLAEMQRLRRMIDMADEKPLLFLADEIMSGTNSHDRRIATEWVVRALVKRGAIGAITTHDLALTEIATSGLAGRNIYFEDSGEGGTLSFDYKLREGILQRSNALNIAHLLGIDSAALEST
jgi:hypothetical protein